MFGYEITNYGPFLPLLPKWRHNLGHLKFMISNGLHIWICRSKLCQVANFWSFNVFGYEITNYGTFLPLLPKWRHNLGHLKFMISNGLHIWICRSKICQVADFRTLSVFSYWIIKLWPFLPPLPWWRHWGTIPFFFGKMTIIFEFISPKSVLEWNLKVKFLSVLTQWAFPFSEL